MTAPVIEIPPPLTCGGCGALVDERQAWHSWPDSPPDGPGGYLILLQEQDTTVHVDIAQYQPRDAHPWSLYGDLFGAHDTHPIAWRHLPPLPEWVQ